MKNVLLFAGMFLLSAFTSVVWAQSDISIGLRGGISIPNLTANGSGSNPLNKGFRSRLGPDAALFADIPVSEHFSIQPMLEYSSQGGKKNGLQAFLTPSDANIYFILQSQPVPPYLFANFKNEVKLSYLLLPVLAKFGSNLGASPFRVYLDAGPFAGYLLSAKAITSGSGYLYTDEAGQQVLPVGSFPFDSKQDVKDQLHKFNAGIEGNLGISYAVGRANIFIEGGGNYGLINIQKDAANGENNTGAVTASIGFSYKFGYSDGY